MQIELSSNFLRKAKRLPRSEKILLSEKLETFRSNFKDPRLKTHPLTGKLKGLFAFSLSYSKRVVFTFVTKDKILIIDVGVHGEVYR